MSLLGAAEEAILEPARAESIIDTLQHSICGSMGKLPDGSVFSLITSLSCFAGIGSRGAFNLFIPLFFDGLERLFSQLPLDSPTLYPRIGVFANSIAHLSFCGRSLLYDFDRFVEIYFHISTNLPFIDYVAGMSCRRRLVYS
jgi:hypothetical protein